MVLVLDEKGRGSLAGDATRHLAGEGDTVNTAPGGGSYEHRTPTYERRRC